MLKNNKEVEEFIKKDGLKLLLVASPLCPHCIEAQLLIDNSPNTLKVCFDYVDTCFYQNTKEFCDENSIDTTPTFMIYDELDEVGRLNHVPKSQEVFFDWITNSII